MTDERWKVMIGGQKGKEGVNDDGRNDGSWECGVKEEDNDRCEGGWTSVMGKRGSWRRMVGGVRQVLRVLTKESKS